MSEVYFLAADADKESSLIEKLETLLERAGIGNVNNGVVALKAHMGERRNKTFIKPRLREETGGVGEAARWRSVRY